MKFCFYVLFSLFLFSHNCFAQSFEGEVIFELGGQDWKDLPAAPIITYIKGGKTLTKLVTPYFAEYIYTDQATQKITGFLLDKKKEGFEISYDSIRQRSLKEHTHISEPVASDSERRLDVSIFDFLAKRYTADIKKDGNEISAYAEIWVADAHYYFPKRLSDAIKKSFPLILAGIFTGNMFELPEFFNKLIDKGLMPVEFGLRGKSEKEIKSKINFIWYDEIKLDDSTFVIPPEIKIDHMK